MPKKVLLESLTIPLTFVFPFTDLNQGEDPGPGKEGEKCVRFTSNVEEPSHLTIQQERDITIYRSFLAIK